MNKSRAYAFTLNNYTTENYNKIIDILQDARYGIVGKEVAETGTPHLQGYIYFANQRSFDGVKRLLPHGTHIEKAKGNAEQNKNYCSKERDFEEFGDCPVSNQRKGQIEKERWENARTFAKADELDKIDPQIYVSKYSNLKKIAEDNQKMPDDLEDVTGVWYYGPPGTGKSHTARANFPGAYIKNQNKWWDGYKNQEHVIIDDFDCASLGHHLKIWADRYAFSGEIKGGTKVIRPKTIVVTSNYHIDEINWANGQMRDAVKRRFKITHFNDVFVRAAAPGERAEGQ